MAASEPNIFIHMLKIAIIIAFRDFRDEEYFIPKDIFENTGANTITFSTEFGTAVGVEGGEAETQDTLNNLKVEDYDAVVFVGGVGAKTLIDNLQAHRIAVDAINLGKTLGAICIAPTILAKAGVLQGKKATVWSSSMDKSAIKILKDGGAIYEEKPVVEDGKLITANGPAAAREFGERVMEVLTAG